MDKVEERAAADIGSAETFRREIVEPCRPVILRGLVRAWPATQVALVSANAFRDYLLQFDAGGEMEAFVGDPWIKGKYYYNEALTGFNFERRRMRLRDALEAIVVKNGAGDPTVYAGSLPTADYLPGFATQNAMPLVGAKAEPRIWLGHASNVSAHYDTLDNLACVVAGNRRFTLYAPELIANLYVGPIDRTMAGQPVSLAASAPHGDPRYPLFETVRDRALQAELGPGDALYLPKLWWHHVEATAPFNALVNYWWDAFSGGPDAPYTSLLFAMITLGERPPAERQAWKALFDHYVFRKNGHPLAHLPADQHGLLGPLKDNYGKIRALIMHLLRGG